MTNLFVNGKFQSSAGETLPWKIDCDALTDDDWATIAYQYAQKIPFKAVYGIPTGGTKFAAALQQYAQPDMPFPLLIVDDVMTTGTSMEAAKAQFFPEYNQVLGLVMFSRMNNPPSWIIPIFQLHNLFCS